MQLFLVLYTDIYMSFNSSLQDPAGYSGQPGRSGDHSVVSPDAFLYFR